MAWLGRLVGRREDTNATIAHAGETNQMYYDNERKRWVERGKEHEADLVQDVGPPPITKPMKIMSGPPPVTAGTRGVYVDAFAEMGFGRANHSAAAPAARPKFELAPVVPDTSFLQEGGEIMGVDDSFVNKVEPSHLSSTPFAAAAPLSAPIAEIRPVTPVKNLFSETDSDWLNQGPQPSPIKLFADTHHGTLNDTWINDQQPPPYYNEPLQQTRNFQVPNQPEEHIRNFQVQADEHDSTNFQQYETQHQQNEMQHQQYDARNQLFEAQHQLFEAQHQHYESHNINFQVPVVEQTERNFQVPQHLDEEQTRNFQIHAVSGPESTNFQQQHYEPEPQHEEFQSRNFQVPFAEQDIRNFQVRQQPGEKETRNFHIQANEQHSSNIESINFQVQHEVGQSINFQEDFSVQEEAMKVRNFQVTDESVYDKGNEEQGGTNFQVDAVRDTPPLLRPLSVEISTYESVVVRAMEGDVFEFVRLSERLSFSSRTREKVSVNSSLLKKIIATNMDGGIVAFALGAMWNLSFHWDQVDMLFVESLIGAIVRALTLHPTHHQVLHHSAGLLTNLASTKFRGAVLISGVVEALIKCVAASSVEEATISQSCQLLCVLAARKEGRTRIAKAGGYELAMKLKSNNQESAKWAGWLAHTLLKA